MKKKLVATIVILLMALVMVRVVSLIIFPVMSMDMGVEQLEDSNTVFQELQVFEWSKTVFNSIVMSVAGISIVLIWLKSIKRVCERAKG